MDIVIWCCICFFTVYFVYAIRRPNKESSIKKERNPISTDAMNKIENVINRNMESKSIDELKALEDMIESIMSSDAEEDWKKLTRINDISIRLNDISRACDRPSSSQLHSEFKNSLIREGRELQKERDKLIKELWDCGFNPTITVSDADGKTTRRKLRDVFGEHMKEDEPPVIEESPKKKERHLRLVKDLNEDS